MAMPSGLVGSVTSRDTPAQNERRPPPRSPATAATTSATTGPGSPPRTGIRATTSWLNPTTGAVRSRPRITCDHAELNRSCWDR